jgi:sigma-E factor negative regulatory protein RseB
MFLFHGNYSIRTLCTSKGLTRSIILFLFLTPQSASAEFSSQQDALQQMSEMVVAMKTLKYRGTLVLYRNGKFDAMKYFHAIENGEEQERLIGLNSPMREVIRNSSKVICIFPDTRQVIVDHRPAQGSFFIEFPDDLTGSDQFYSFTLQGLEKIAMMTAWVVAIEPKDKYRYARKVWISQENKLPLKYELFNSGGSVIEQAAFIEISLDNELPIRQVTKVDDLGMRVRHINKLESIPFEQAGFSLKNRPEGFETVFFTRRKMHETETYVEHLKLSDGFSSVSVYLEEGKQSNGETGYKAIGSINSYTRKINDYQITVIGLVPVKTVQFIAEGIKLKKVTID